MINRRRITEEDLLVTEALIAESYGQLKQSVARVPSKACESVVKTLSDHPYATAGTAVVGGVALYGIIKMMTSHSSGQGAGRDRERDTCRPNHMHDMLTMVLPLVTPYLAGYVQKYLGSILSEHRD
jgi:hypothetical protein